MPPRAAKILVVGACLLGMAGMASGQSYSVNYRGQQQEDLTCMQANVTLSTGETIAYRNDPSTNCFGFPSIQFDTVPVVGGEPNSFTIDWSLMVDELQMQDDDRLHFHLPGFTGGMNTFGIMGPSVDTLVNGIQYTPNFRSEFVAGDSAAAADQRADFGALVGIWGISCGTEQNLYMDRAKVDNLRTAEWDPATEMLKVVIKGRRFGPATGRHDGYTGPVASAPLAWNTPAAGSLQGQIITQTALSIACTSNVNCFRGAQMQAMEYSREGPTWGNPTTPNTNAAAVTTLAAGLVVAAIPTGGAVTYKNDGYIMAPGSRVCGIYVDSTKLYRGQLALNIQNGLGPLPPFGGIGKNWYKVAYMRRFASSLCSGGTANAAGLVTRPGMSPETCSFVRTKSQASLATFWQVPFDGDTERVVGFQFTTTDGMLPVNKYDQPAGALFAPGFSYAVAEGRTTGPNLDNCITVSLIPTVTMVSGSSATRITIQGLNGAVTSDNDNLPLFSNSGCSSAYSALAGSDGLPIRNFRPVAGGGVGRPDALKQNYRPFGQANVATSTGATFVPPDSSLTARTSITSGVAVPAATAALTRPTMAATGYDGWGYYDDADWHTWAKQGTISALTVNDPFNGATTASAMTGVTSVGGAKLSSPNGAMSVASGTAQWRRSVGDAAEGQLTVNLSPGYFVQKGELLVFSFLLKNAAAPTPNKELTVSATGTWCPSDNGFCDGVADRSLDIVRAPMRSRARVLETRLPSFRDAVIYQSSSDPNSLTTLFVTLRTNVDLNRRAPVDDAKISISGLCGFQTGTNVVLYQNQKSGGQPFDGSWPREAVRSRNDLPGLTADDSSIISHTAEYVPGTGTLIIDLGATGLAHDVRYAFAFQLTTVNTANEPCTPRVSSTGGSDNMAPQDMTASNVGRVSAPAFTTLKIGQVTTRPNVPNFICVTLQHNFEFYTDSAVTGGGNTQQAAGYVESKITISGLTGTASVSRPAGGVGYALAYCPTELPYFDDRATQHTSTQFQPLTSTEFGYMRYATDLDPTCINPADGPQRCVPGNPYTPRTGVIDSTKAGRSWFGGQTERKDHFTWDQGTGTAVLTVDPLITALTTTEPASPKGGIPKNAEIVFALVLQNPPQGQECTTPTFQASGRITQGPVAMSVTRTGRALQDGEKDGDACPLKVYSPGFLVKKIVQSTAVTDEENTMTVSIRSNVDFASTASGTASFITITGLTGTQTTNGDLGIRAPSYRFSPRFERNQGAWTQSTGTMVLKLDAGACRPPTVWAAGNYFRKSINPTTPFKAPFALGGTDGAGLTVATGAAATTVSGSTQVTEAGGLNANGGTAPSACIKAGFLYVFEFNVRNPRAEQPNGPTVEISGRYRNSDDVEVIVPAMGIDPPIGEDADRIPMAVSNTLLTTAKIGQLVPAPGATNVICVTLQSSKDIETTESQLLSQITISGLTGFDADQQDLQLFENDGVTTITPQAGNPANGNEYAVGGIFKARNSADTVDNIAFVRYSGRDTGDVSMEIVGNRANSNPSVARYFQRNVDHKFCFRLQNPETPMDCKTVTITTVNKGVRNSVTAELDVTTTIEDYPSRSACPGYVAPPGFVVKNWRSSSNITSDAAIIHLELASNFELEPGDKFTVSGLTSYTRSCSSYPCDVGITVTRTAVNRRFGKPYINGRRNVNGVGLSDAGATQSSRRTFAVEIQSYDLTGQKDDGSLTSTFGDVAKWGVNGDTESTASTLTFTVARASAVIPADIKTSTEATMYEVVFKLDNRADATANPNIQIAIEDFAAQAVDTGMAQRQYGVSNIGGGGMDITYTATKTIYGGESLILTLPKFQRDSNGMLFGITSEPSTAFSTYANWADWKAYGTDEDYARAFFTNGWWADGVSAKSGDAGQTGERWNYPNVNAKITTDADFNHDTGVFVLDPKDPGVGKNKDYWYAATEDNVYEGRVTPVAYDGTRVAPGGARTNPATVNTQQAPGRFGLPEATADYYLDNGEALDPIMTAVAAPETLGVNPVGGAVINTNAYRRPVGVALDQPGTVLASANIGAGTGGATQTGVSLRYNNWPAPIPGTLYTPSDNYPGTPPFKGIPAKYQPSRRDNFYKGMLMKCWIGTARPPRGAPTDYSEDFANDQGGAVNGFIFPAGYRPASSGVTELLPPPLRSVQSAYGDQATVLSTGGVHLSAVDINNANAFAKAGISRVLETRVIQASFRQIDYIPRRNGGCHYVTTTTVPGNTPVVPTTQSATTFGTVGCQDEVPGYPAIVRLESPFSRALDPDTLCYIQRKSHVGVYTGMTAMIGEMEYTIKQGAANIYTVAHVNEDMEDRFGNAVDRKVPRSYSTEDAGLSATGLRGAANTVGFFRDTVGISGQAYTIYSQLELVAKRGSTVALGETITIRVPSAAGIFPPANVNAPITPVTANSDSIASRIKISHVLLVPLSAACSIVGAYGVPSGCQAGNGKGGAFDLILSSAWPYAYDSENGNDITGYGMTVFGGQSTVIKSMADGYSQDLPIRPLEGAHTASGTPSTGAVQPSTAVVAGILDAQAGTYNTGAGATGALGEVGGRLQTSPSNSERAVYAGGWPSSTSTDANTRIFADFTVRRELDAVSLGGTARADAVRAPRLPNSPITLIHGGCGTLADTDGQVATLPYAVCLSLAGGVAHNQELKAHTTVGATALVSTMFDEIGANPADNSRVSLTLGQGVSYVQEPPGTNTNLFRPKVKEDLISIVTGPQDITGAVGQMVTPVVADRHAPTKTGGSFPATANYGTYAPIPLAGSNPITSYYEEAGDNLGLGAYIIVGVYNTGTSDRFVWARQGNKGTQLSALPVATDMAANLVIQRYLGVSREAIPLANIPSGLIGGNIANQPAGGTYPAPSGNVPRYQARIGGGYSIGRFAYGVSNIMRVRSDVTSMARPTGMSWTNAAANPSNTFPITMDGTAGVSLARAGGGVAAADLLKDAAVTSFTAVPHGFIQAAGLAAAGAHPSGHTTDVTTPTIQEALVFGQSTLPLPQVIHTAMGRASGTTQRNFLSRGTCGTVGNGQAGSEILATGAAPERCIAASFNTNLPFSRNVYIEQGQDVYIVSSIFDTLIQRPEPPRKHLGLTVNGFAQTVSPGWFATQSNTNLGDVTDSPTAIPTSAFFPGNGGVAGGFSNTAPIAVPASLPADFTADNQRFGLIQTLGTPKNKGSGNRGAWSTTAANQGQVPDHNNQYGFDQDFRLYSVLGPFMRPARIKDVYDGSKITGAAQSKFPGILTIHGANAEKDQFDAAIPIVQELVVATNNHAWQNNALWSMAPVAGTSYARTATAADTATGNDGRLTQYHRYVEADKILTFCNPMQGYLNNAPGAMIMNDISDSPTGIAGLLPQSAPATPGQSTDFGFGKLAAADGPGLLRQATSNGDEASAPSVWNVPRRHHICRKMVTGNPLLTEEDMVYAAATLGGAQVTKAAGAADTNDWSAARARFTESVQFNNVLNQEPSPNMRGMITFVEPTRLMIDGAVTPPGPPVDAGTCLTTGRISSSTSTTNCQRLEVRPGPNTRVQIATPNGRAIPSWFSLTAQELGFEGYENFGPLAGMGTVLAGMIEGIPQADLKYGLNWYDKRLMLGNFLRTVVPLRNNNESEAERVTYTVFHRATRNVSATDLAEIDTNLNNNRRRLLATFCPDGFDARLIGVGSPTSEACNCPTSCGAAEASCASTKGGTVDWNQVQLLERTCRKEGGGGGDNVGAIVGGVLGGFFGALLLALLVWFCCCRGKGKKGQQEPTGRPMPPPEPMQERGPAPSKPLAPVYLPQPYPALPEQFAPAPMPAYPEMGVVQPTGQPTLYSSMSAMPAGMPYPPMSGSFPAAAPPMSASYAPYGVVQQPMY
eukprot:CAMPEP_0206219836 /NCGR_PEP_ID=MMETSP0047_2-20121206/4528_1 /ASSEMBLY_ACC=CAM_ASM_000192 /TAXON_ID=195065 /ORGANISM="Chroomonas mesostigmatica_cf, Strain CCMP1168" /LENGTH=3848 /DNA_ID=CAMNT_0053642399 /DNA_START=64 /DNA_END=11610 /DNA_ORIENTATION=+